MSFSWTRKNACPLFNIPSHLISFRVTEILDVAPIDFFSGMSVKTWEAYNIPEEVMPKSARTQSMDFEFHWVSQKGPGNTIKLTSGIRLDPTVSSHSPDARNSDHTI